MLLLWGKIVLLVKMKSYVQNVLKENDFIKVINFLKVLMYKIAKAVLIMDKLVQFVLKKNIYSMSILYFFIFKLHCYHI